MVTDRSERGTSLTISNTRQSKSLLLYASPTYYLFLQTQPRSPQGCRKAILAGHIMTFSRSHTPDLTYTSSLIMSITACLLSATAMSVDPANFMLDTSSSAGISSSTAPEKEWSAELVRFGGMSMALLTSHPQGPGLLHLGYPFEVLPIGGEQ